MSVYVFFYLKHSQSNDFSFFVSNFAQFYGTLTKCAERVISDWIVLEVKTQERRWLEQTNQELTFTFQWKSNKQIEMRLINNSKYKR